MSMKKRIIFGLSLAGLLVFSSAVLPNLKDEKSEVVSGYSASSLPTTIDLNDSTEENIRSYYSSLNNLDTSERQGTNLLKNLKTILKNGQKYYSYENGESIWKMYEITDRDWEKSPASAISGYNSQTKKITGYSYGSGTDPYVRALYINRDVENQTKARANHNQDQWGINREHLWPKAEGFDSSGAGGARGDPFHLVAANGYVNNIHSNYFYGYVKTSSSYTDCGSKYSNQAGNLRGTSKTLNTGTVFEPQDCDKGDIARSIFYMAARYNYWSGSDSDGINTNNPNLVLTQDISKWSSSGYTSTTSTKGYLGIISDLLNWHHEDPVDEYEIHRNNLLYKNFTNNRNPFIDFPEWADFIWGTADYDGTTFVEYDKTPTGYATPSSDTINDYNDSGETISVTGVSLNKDSTTIKVGGAETLTASISPRKASNKTVTWSTSDSDVATVSGGTIRGIAEGTATITVTTADGGFTDTCTVTVSASGGGGGEEDSDEGSVEAADGAFEGWTPSGLGTAYKDGSAKFDDSGDNVYKLDIFSGDVSSNMTSLTVTINGKINGTPTAANSYKVEALDSSGNVLANDTKTGSDVVTTSYGDTVFTISSGLAGCTGIRITYVTKGGGNWGIKTISWSAEYSSETPKTLESIELDTSDAPTSFYVGDTFSYEGLSVTANYSDGTDDIVTPTSVSSPNMSTAGEKTITVTYTEGNISETATYTITVLEAELTSIEVSNPRTSFKVGATFEFGGTVTANYNNGSSVDVTLSANFDGYDLSTAGSQTVTVSFGGKTTTYSITVTEGGGGTDSTEYRLINSSEDLETDKSYIITNGKTGTVKAIAVTSNANNRKSTEVTVSGGKITRGSSVMSFTLESSSGNWLFATENYAGTDGYLASANSGDNNQLRVISTANTASISFNGDAATINIGPHGSRTLVCFNSTLDNNNGGFSCYSAQGSYGLIYLWKEVDSSEEVTSITATLKESKNFIVGETISKSDIVVKTNLNEDVTDSVTFADYQFTYSDAASGGTLTNKEFNITYLTFSTTLTVKVQRVNRVTPDAVSDTLTCDDFVATNTTYKDFSNVSKDSDAKYAGNTAKGNSGIQITNGSPKGIVSTASGGNISKVKVVWINNTTDGRTLNVYGSNTAYSSAADLYNDTTDGTLLGTIVKGTSTTLVINGEYAYVGVRSAGSAMYLASITFTYGTEDSATNLSNYIMYEDTNNQCSTKTSIAEGYFEGLSKEERSTFMNSTDYVISTARERFEAWLRHEGKTISVSDDDYVVSKNRYFDILAINIAEEPDTMLVIVIALSLMTTLGLFVIYKKKRGH